MGPALGNGTERIGRTSQISMAIISFIRAPLTLRVSLRRKEVIVEVVFRHDYAALDSLTLASGRTLKSCPDTCLVV